MQRVKLLGLTGNISVLWREAVLRRNVFTLEEHVKEKGVPCLKLDEREHEEKILQPFTHLKQVPGVHLMERIHHAYNYWLKVPEDTFNVLKEIYQLIHHFYLLIDDIQDNSILRRGMPVAHSIYGVPSTLNATNYLLLKMLKKVQSLNHPDAITEFTEHMLETYYGQGLEMCWHDNFTCPSLEEYKQMSKKRNEFWIYNIVMMQLLTGNKSDLTKLNSLITMHIQIHNDYSNLCAQKYTNDKGYCEDISEGKFSFPIIHAIMSHPDDHQVINILQQKTRNVELKKYCFTLLEKFGSLSYTRRIIKEFDAEMRAEIAKLGGNPFMEKLLNDLLDWTNDRDDKNTEQ